MSTTITTPKKQTAKRRLNFGDDDDDVPNKMEHVAIVDLTQDDSVSASIFETPQKKRRTNDGDDNQSKAKAIVVVTPEKEEEEVKPTTKKTSSSSSLYIPTYIHKNLGYQRKGEASLSPTRIQAFELLERYFIIPFDFEQNHRYGPLSGTCFEERVISAYNLSLLKPKDERVETIICSQCATLGHKRNDCPDLI